MWKVQLFSELGSSCSSDWDCGPVSFTPKNKLTIQTTQNMGETQNGIRTVTMNLIYTNGSCNQSKGVGRKDLTYVTLENNILTRYYKAEDKTTISECHNPVNVFLARAG